MSLTPSVVSTNNEYVIWSFSVTLNNSGPATYIINITEPVNSVFVENLGAGVYTPGASVTLVNMAPNSTVNIILKYQIPVVPVADINFVVDSITGNDTILANNVKTDVLSGSFINPVAGATDATNCACFNLSLEDSECTTCTTEWVIDTEVNGTVLNFDSSTGIGFFQYTDPTVEGSIIYHIWCVDCANGNDYETSGPATRTFPPLFTDSVAGPQGTAGADGAQGPQGETGDTGAQGSQGNAGAQGAQGSQGSQGSAGAQGTQGSTGSQGNQGATGAQGAQGSQGNQGTQGVAGQGITLSGTVNDVIDLPGGASVGDAYLVEADGHLYVWNGAAWFDAGELTGPQGAQGTQGVQGSTGAAGAQGAQGSAGAQGNQGTQGASGSQGSQGVQGAAGPQGTQGTTGSVGAQGSQGTQGSTGATGAQGNQGSTGAQGATGAQGPQGNQGTQGATGSQGSQGNQGTQGPQGNQGTQGPQGNQGSQGSQGTQGSTGATGAQGNQGSQGAQGATGAQGNQGAQGAQGSIGIFGGDSQPYTFSTTTTDADPGSGILRFNNATPSSVTELYIDNTNADSVSVTTWLDALDDSTNTAHKGVLRVVKKTDSSKFADFQIVSVADSTGYRTVTVTYIVGNSTFANTDNLFITFSRSGNVGAQGSTGSFATAQSITTDVSTSYRLVLGDAGKLVTLSNASPIVLTVPANATTAFSTGTRIDFVTLGAGAVTVTPETGSVNIYSPAGTLATSAQYERGLLEKIDTNTWIVSFYKNT